MFVNSILEKERGCCGRHLHSKTYWSIRHNFYR